MLEKILSGEAEEDDFDEECKLRDVSTQLECDFTEKLYNSRGNLVVVEPSSKAQPTSSVETMASPRSIEDDNPSLKSETPPVQARRRKGSSYRKSSSNSNKRNKRSRTERNTENVDHINRQRPRNDGNTDEISFVNEELPEKWQNWKQYYDNQQHQDTNINNQPEPNNGATAAAEVIGSNPSSEYADENQNTNTNVRMGINGDGLHRFLPSVATQLKGAEREKYVEDLMARHRTEASKSYGQSMAGR